MSVYCDVVVARALAHACFTYRVPDGVGVRRGQVVRVPLGRGYVWGVVWQTPVAAPAGKRLKDLEEWLACVLDEALLGFLEQAARYTLGPLGGYVKMALSSPEALKQYGQLHAKCVGNIDTQRTEEAVLSIAQSKAVQALARHSHGVAGFCVSVLEGETGSGKTEVYFRWLERVLASAQEQLKAQAQCVVLLPEIALTAQWVARFQKRFGYAPLLWHSGVTPAQRRNAWYQVQTGHARVVCGARSALFLPYKSLCAIVADEEHDGSYKQEEGICYQARDMAVLRGRAENIPVVLASATPSVETLWNVGQGRYQKVDLKERFQAQHADVHLITHHAQEIFAPSLIQALKQALKAGQQSMVFLNRRGYAPFVRCKGCGKLARCPSCDISLVLHDAKRHRPYLLCHLCGHRASERACPSCEGEQEVKLSGLGIEQVCEALQEALPAANIQMMSSDVMTTPRKLDTLIGQLEQGDVDVVVGTQMLAKGHHFPGVTCVGILNGDDGLYSLDFRAHERLGQMLTQVTGRAGRGQHKGSVFVQTQNPEHPLLQALVRRDYTGFSRALVQARQAGRWPPFVRLCALIISGKREAEIKQYAMTLRECAVLQCAQVNGRQVPEVLGPVPAPISYIRGHYRWRFLVRAEKHFALQNWIAEWLQKAPAPRQIAVKIDIDPYSLL